MSGSSGVRLTLLAHAAPRATEASRIPHDAAADPRALERLTAGRAPPVLSFDRIRCSPARAAGETVAALGLAATQDPVLRDRDHGSWAGRSLAEIARSDPDEFAAWLREPGARAPGGESGVEVEARLAPWLETCAATPGRVLAVTHPFVIRACVMHALAGSPAAWSRIDIAYGSRTVLTHSGAFWRIGLLNGPW